MYIVREREILEIEKDKTIKKDVEKKFPFKSDSWWILTREKIESFCIIR